MGSSSRNSLFTYIRPKVVGSYASGSYVHQAALLKGSPGAAVKLLPCDHEVMGSSPENSLLHKCRGMLCTYDPKWSAQLNNLAARLIRESRDYSN
jgi:hypothetical protein